MVGKWEKNGKNMLQLAANYNCKLSSFKRVANDGVVELLKMKKY